MNNNRYGLPGDIREISTEDLAIHSKYLEELTDYEIHGSSTGRFTGPNRLYEEAVTDALTQVTLTGSGADFFRVEKGDIDLTQTSCDVKIRLFEKIPEYWPDKTTEDITKPTI